MNLELWQSVDRYFLDNDVAGAIAMLEGLISNHDARQFAAVLDACFVNPHESIVNELDRFIEANARQFDVKAVYLEMNGFDINYDRWYFELFAYSSRGKDPEDLEWLCNWQSPDWPAIELRGMTAAQEAFAWYHEQEVWKSLPEIEPVYEAAMLLVMSKFAALIGAALNLQPLARPAPILATAHGFDIVARYDPSTPQGARDASLQ